VKVLILRPEPGAGETAARARAMGLDPVVAPLFTLRPLAWTPPDPAGFDAVMLTSASAARLAGGGMTPFLSLPCFAVGERTAAAARGAGFADVRAGPGDAEALRSMMAAEGRRRAFHPCGREHMPFDEIVSVPVYAADSVDRLPDAAASAIAAGAVALLHSPRAAALFAELAGPLRTDTSFAAISPAAAEAAGGGWRSGHAAEAPRDQALLELAAKLCQDAAS
jgi:uroporphyrinogen-III synthase